MRFQRSLPLFVLTFLLGGTFAQPPLPPKEKPIWLCITTPEFKASVQGLADVRRNQEFDARISTLAPKEALQSLERKPAYILIVGDDEEGLEAAPWMVKAERRELYRWRSVQPKTFPTDVLLGDFNNDGTPEIPVGRLPARTAEEALFLCTKAVTSEAKERADPDNRFLVLAGTPGYDPKLDAMATGLIVRAVRKHAPLWSEPFIISGSPGSAYAGVLEEQPGRFVREARRGSYLNVIMAHASPERVLLCRDESRSIYLDASHAHPRWENDPAAAPMVFLTCDSGQFHRKKPCLAEEYLALRGGPAIAIAATTESHPLTNYHTGMEVLKAMNLGHKRVGDFWLAAQLAAQKARDLVMDRTLRDIEGKLEEEIDIAKLRRDQLLLYAFLGDPATPVRMPNPLKIETFEVEGKKRWRVQKRQFSTKLMVSRRPSPEAAKTKDPGNGASPEALRTAFEAANAAFTYQPWIELDTTKPWEGEFESGFQYRFTMDRTSDTAAIAP